MMSRLMGDKSMGASVQTKSQEIFEKSCENDVLKNKIFEVKNKINELETKNVNDSIIVKYLTVTKLINIVIADLINIVISKPKLRKAMIC